MITETAKRCAAEAHRFLKAWEDFQMRAALEVVKPEDKCFNPSKVKDWLDYTGYCNKERAALRRASLDLSQALADLRQGR